MAAKSSTPVGDSSITVEQDGPTLVAQIESIFRDDADGRRTVRVGGTTAGLLAAVLSDARTVYQGWLTSRRASGCEREVATLRLVAIEEALIQLGALDSREVIS